MKLWAQASPTLAEYAAPKANVLTNLLIASRRLTFMRCEDRGQRECCPIPLPATAIRAGTVAEGPKNES